MIVGRSTDYTRPGKVKTRSEDWFIAAGAGRDAAKAGKTREDNPYVPNRPDWRAWREGWQCQTLHGEDVTRRYRMAERKYRGRGQVDYTADALHDFARYAVAPDLPDELRQFASETYRQVKREAAIKARVCPIAPAPFRRTAAELEAAVEMVIRRWPDVGITEISMSTGIMDGRIRKTQAWQRHSAAKEEG